MTVSHARRESELFESVVALLALHAHSVATTDRALLLAVFIHAHVVHDLVTELMQHLLNALLDVFTGLVRHVSYRFLSALDHGHLGSCKLIDILSLTGTALVHKTDRAHLQHKLTMLHQVLAEGVLEDEKLVIEMVLCGDTVLVLYGLLPHAHELPFLELAEETVGLDVVI